MCDDNLPMWALWTSTSSDACTGEMYRLLMCSQKYFVARSIKELFESINIHVIFNFIRQTDTV